MASDMLLQQKVEIYLNTPLFPFRYKEGRTKKQFMDDVTHISGMVLEEREGGLVVGVDAISNQKRTEERPPIKRIYLPFHKVDFVICV